jgi:tetratricopeptide (TPR) repeat protein
MAEDDPSRASGSEPNAALIAAALGAASGARNVDALIERQITIADLQIEDMRREDKLRHWSLRVRHVSDVMKLTFELALAFIVVAVMALICVTVWQAAHDNSLVIEAFSVPPDMAARGLSGETVAAQVQDKLAMLQDATLTSRPADSYASNWGDDVKVEIPDTGMSIGEFYRLLVSWFGHQSRITGEVFRTPQGIAIAVRTSGQPGDIVRGTDADLDGLVQQAAEAIYARTQPYRYANYLVSIDPAANAGKAIAIWNHLVQTGSTLDKVWSYMALGTMLERSDPIHAAAVQRKAIPLASDFALAYQNISAEEMSVGHDEAGLIAGRKDVEIQSKGNGGMTARAHNVSFPAEQSLLMELEGDFGAALQDNEIAADLPDYSGVGARALLSEAYDIASLHENARATRLWSHLPPPEYPKQVAQLLEILRMPLDVKVVASLHDWRAVLATAARLENLLSPTPPFPFTPAFAEQTMSRQVWPYTAQALAHSGDMKGAEALIARAPLDCRTCVQMRGDLATLRKDWAEAAHWYALASAQSPSIPFADTEWGAMLMAKGDLDGAIAKFESANRKGPHFADPLEMWGEALIAKNRSDLALAKFAEAAKYAPNWGRLHLKWGEALLWSGNRDEAKKQFAIAATLDLASTEKSELARVSHG